MDIVTSDRSGLILQSSSKILSLYWQCVVVQLVVDAGFGLVTSKLVTSHIHWKVLSPNSHQVF